MRPRFTPSTGISTLRASSAARRNVPSPPSTRTSSQPFGGALVGVDDLDVDAERAHVVGMQVQRAVVDGLGREYPQRRCRCRPAPSPRAEPSRWPRPCRCGRPAGRSVRTSLRALVDGACDCAPPARRRRAGGRCRARRCRKYSTLPDGPGSGLAVTSTVCQSSSAALRATVSTDSARSAGSLTTPPAPTRSLPTSNCGFTMGTISAPADAHAVSAGKHRGQRDEGQVGDHQVDGPADRVGGQVADVGALHHGHPRIGSQRPRQLAVADVGCDDFAGASVQQHFGEAARRGAGVQAAPAVDGHGEGVQSTVELVGAPRDPVAFVRRRRR